MDILRSSKFGHILLGHILWVISCWVIQIGLLDNRACLKWSKHIISHPREPRQKLGLEHERQLTELRRQASLDSLGERIDWRVVSWLGQNTYKKRLGEWGKNRCPQSKRVGQASGCILVFLNVMDSWFGVVCGHLPVGPVEFCSMGDRGGGLRHQGS